MSGPLRAERPAEGVALLTLDVPERRNAMTTGLTAAWSEGMTALASEPGLRAVVLTGAGGVFCSGGDLSWIEGGGPNTPDTLRAKMYGFYRTWLSVRDLDVPVLAAVNGPAIGAGLCLALACDLRYAVPTAHFAAPFTMLGMHPGMAATYLLPEVIGLPRAREMLLAGHRVDAEEAAAIGLVNRVVAAETLLETAVETARGIAAAAPVATRLTKAALRDGHYSYGQALEWEALAQGVTMATDDIREGLKAQAERRRPAFRGR